jgi:hypothetical protein
MTARLTPDILDGIVKAIPDVWLEGDSSFRDHHASREAYRQYLRRRLEPPHSFAEEAIRAHSRYL